MSLYDLTYLMTALSEENLARREPMLICFLLSKVVIRPQPVRPELKEELRPLKGSNYLPASTAKHIYLLAQLELEGFCRDYYRK